jgi:cytochrome c-type biogenesis protein CcmF
MTALGEISLALALVVSIYTTAVSWWGGKADNPIMIKSGRNAFLSIFVLLLITGAALLNALITHDFSLEYVYNYSNKDLPLFYTVSAFWAGQAGSLLLWALMLAGFGSLVLIQNRVHNQKLMPYVTAIISATIVLYTLLMVFASPVFKKLPAIPPDGYGLNPMLQNPGMVFHPPSLYIGMVAFIVPYAFAMAALITKQLGDAWIISTRRWTIFAWFFLSMGNLLGANWAYVELGWGGYWAWDPVENASFMPWLVGTAFLHSVMIQERRDMLKFWGVILITTTFILTIFGTFITRSGLISSVHAFGETTVGIYFGVFILISIFFSIYLIYSRRDILKSANQLDSMLSRQSSFLFNNLILLGAAFAIFWGTIFPMISEAVRGVKITVGPPFFNMVMAPIGIALLILTGFCPLLSWRKATVSNLQKNFLVPVLTTAAGGAFLIVMGVSQILPWLIFTAGIFVTVTIFMEVYRGVRTRAANRKENYPKALLNLVWRNKRRYGGYIIHIGVVCLFLGFAGSAFKQEIEFSVSPGEATQFRDYKLTYYGYTDEWPRPTKEEVVATLLVEKDGKKLGYVQPEKNFYTNQNMPNSEVAIYSTLKEDLYVIFAALNEDGLATFKVHVNPLVKWLWIGGVIIGIGTIIVMWPDAREQKRFEERYAEA